MAEAPVLQTSYDTPASLAQPRSPRLRSNGNFERTAWMFMRFSGVALVFLTIGHLMVGLHIDEGVHRIDWAYVADRWRSPFWATWDLLMLWLAQLHGANGVRTVISDYARKDSTRFWLHTILLVATVLVLALGTYAIFGLAYDVAPGV